MKISSSCYVISGLSAPPPWAVNSGFITGSEKTLVIDTGMNYMSARTIYGYAHNMKPGNEMIVVNTEPHFDHIGGNCLFRDKGIDVYGHKNIRRPASLIEWAKEEYNESIKNVNRRSIKESNAYYLRTKVANPNKNIEPGDSFDLGDIRVSVIGTPGHTPANLSFFVNEEKILYSGDSIVTRYIPNLEIGDRSDWKIWFNSLDSIKKMNPNIIVPGHGDIINKEMIEIEIDRMRKILYEAIEKGEAPT